MGEAALWREYEKIRDQVYRWLFPKARYDGMLPGLYELEEDICHELRLQPRTVSLVLAEMREEGLIKGFSRINALGYRYPDERGYQLAGADQRPAVRAEWQRSRYRKQLRSEIRAGLHLCATCKTTDDLTIDHITPIDRGGNNDPTNLQILCRACNTRKGTKLVTNHV